MMRSLLLVDGQPNRPFIFAVGSAALALYLMTMARYYANLDSDVTIALLNVATVAAGVFARPFVWSLTLQRIPDTKVMNILIPALVIALVTAAFQFVHFLLNAVAGANHFPAADIFAAQGLFQYIVAPVIMVAICEQFYNHFRDKLLLYVVSAEVVFLLSTYTIIFSYGSYQDSIFSSLFTGAISSVGHAAIFYFLALFILRVNKAKAPLEPTAKQQETALLTAYIADKVQEQHAASAILDTLQQANPHLSYDTLGRAYARSINLEKKQKYKTANALMIAMMIISAGYAYAVLYTNSRFHSFNSFTWMEDMGWFLLQTALLALCVFKFKLSADMVTFRPYAYKVVAGFGVLGALMSLSDVFSSGENVLPAVGMLLNIALVITAVTVSQALYPHYKLFGKHYTPEDFVVDQERPI